MFSWETSDAQNERKGMEMERREQKRKEMLLDKWHQKRKSTLFVAGTVFGDLASFKFNFAGNSHEMEL